MLLAPKKAQVAFGGSQLKLNDKKFDLYSQYAVYSATIKKNFHRMFTY